MNTSTDLKNNSSTEKEDNLVLNRVSSFSIDARGFQTWYTGFNRMYNSQKSDKSLDEQDKNFSNEQELSQCSTEHKILTPESIDSKIFQKKPTFSSNSKSVFISPSSETSILKNKNLSLTNSQLNIKSVKTASIVDSNIPLNSLNETTFTLSSTSRHSLKSSKLDKHNDSQCSESLNSQKPKDKILNSSYKIHKKKQWQRLCCCFRNKKPLEEIVFNFRERFIHRQTLSQKDERNRNSSVYPKIYTNDGLNEEVQEDKYYDTKTKTVFEAEENDQVSDSQQLVPYCSTLPTEISKQPRNEIRNQKYSVISFIPLVLYEQFQFFFNLYFLFVALSQFQPLLQVGYRFTYQIPLCFVLSVTMIKEAYDDFQRYRRDKEANSQIYERLIPETGEIERIPSSAISVGDLILVHTNQRVPADMVLFRTNTENKGSVFIRTDQLDGETDQKLRRAIPSLQKLNSNRDLLTINARMAISPPTNEIYEFCGNFVHLNPTSTDKQDLDLGDEISIESLKLENTLQANTVVASGTVVGCAVYTGKNTRSVMNTVSAPFKVGILDLEVNSLAKKLFIMMVVVGFALGLARGVSGLQYLVSFRFILLLSSVVPISLRVNLDMSKSLYSYMMMRDNEIPNTIVRNSTIPEELGRLSYLFSDKTGTLTQNVMRFKKMLIEPSLCLDVKHLEMIRQNIAKTIKSSRQSRLDKNKSDLESTSKNSSFTVKSESSSLSKTKSRNSIYSPLLAQSHHRSKPNSHKLQQSQFSKKNDHRINQIVYAMALCHNVTPTIEEDGSRAYQASSPDEIALVKFAESVGLELVDRDTNRICLMVSGGVNHDAYENKYDILKLFPFTSETKRMGIILRCCSTNKIYFYLKGAETVMQTKIDPVFQLQEEVDNIAREGLRTLVFAVRILSEDEYQDFAQRYDVANSVIQNREAQVQSVIETIETSMQLLGISGVEDSLQEDVKPTLELLKQAGIRVQMLTGDKAETAVCIGRSTGLISHGKRVKMLIAKNRADAARLLGDIATDHDLSSVAFVIDGPSLQLCLDFCQQDFFDFATKVDIVIVCRCSPTQKATVVKMTRDFTKLRVCAVGDGGNDVSMIQEANVGIGIVGLEGRQASLAADFSVERFSYILKLILWHGRNSYLRSARLSQFVFHRGLIIAIMQAVFSTLFFFATISLFDGLILVGYTTIYTMFPVFSLVLDEDVSYKTVLLFPQLYEYLQKGRELAKKAFFIQILQSVYQGGIIMQLSIALFHEQFLNIVAITYTALILSQLLNVALEITTQNRLIFAAEIGSLIIYICSLFILPTYFDQTFVTSNEYIWKTLVITCVSCIPVQMCRYIRRKLRPPPHTKIRSDE